MLHLNIIANATQTGTIHLKILLLNSRPFSFKA